MAKNNFEVGFVFGAKKAATFDKAFSSVNQSICGIVKGIAGVASAYVGVKALTDTASQALKSASSLEGYRSTLNVVMKDTEKAAQTMQWAVGFANRTPFETDSIVEATVRLESYGLKAQEVMPQIGDMAGVMNKDIMQAVEAVADAQTGELERMKEFGITKAMLIKKAGEMYRGVEVVNSKGQIVDQEKFNTAMFTLMEDRFSGGMEIQAGSFKGLMSTVQGVWKTGLASMAGMSSKGEIIDGSMFDIAKDSITSVAEKLQTMAASGAFEKIGISIGNGLTFIIDIAGDVGTAIKAGFELAKPVIEWAATEAFPAVAVTVVSIAEKAAEMGQAIKENWAIIAPIVGGIMGAMVGYKAVCLATAAAEKVRAIATKFSSKEMALATIKQLGFNTAMIANPVTWIVIGIVAAIGALIAVGVLLWKNWDVIKAKGMELWVKMQEVFINIQNYFGGMVTALANKFPLLATALSGPVETIKGIFNGLKTVFTGIVDFVAGVFTGDWQRAWEGVKGIFGGVFDSFAALAKAPINGVIGIINAAIEGINGVTIDVPDWVPGIGGQTYGFTIPTIPMLAEGGIATAPTLAMVGEGKEKEAIMPLSKLQGLLSEVSISSVASSLSGMLQKLMTSFDVGGGGDTIQFAPQLVFNGPADRDTVDRAMAQSYQEFKRFMAQYEQDKRRTAMKRG